jgi:hypothetical protein
MENKLEQIKNRQLARLMNELRAINTPQIIQDAVGKYFNFMYLDFKSSITGTKENNDKFNN